MKMKLLILPIVLIASTAFAQQTHINHAVAIPESHPKPVAKTIIRPLLRENAIINQDSDIGTFLNNLTATCPDGMVTVDSKHLLNQSMTYGDAFNAMANLECKPKDAK
jgi:hypothetical protein